MRKNGGQGQAHHSVAILDGDCLAGEGVLKTRVLHLLGKNDTGISPYIADRRSMRVAHLQKESARHRYRGLRLQLARERNHVIRPAATGYDGRIGSMGE